MTTSASIPIAAFKDVYDVSVVDRALSDLSPGASEALKSTYEKMLVAGGTRLSVKPSGVPVLDELYDELPNFAEVLDDIRKHIALCSSSNDPMELPPMLLLGEPGIGKTHFCRRIARLLTTGYGLASMSSMTAGWVLSGASSQWRNAKPGKVFDTLLHGSYANPVIVVDEIDKAGGETQHDPLGALYSLLERDTAREFVDEFVEVPVDASSVVWIATANEESRIPEPILNRMNTYSIQAPDRDGSRRVAQAIYAEIRSSHAWGKSFSEAPAPLALDRLAEMGPREMRRAIMNAFGSAKLAHRDEIQVDDIEGPRAPKKQRIGF
ncbi:MAG TPA: AAA family ATPase [Burkholderiales bacterium]|jgi:ATP-dependent Lon protease|nr:AAA family ATPase [Burkholderiales bacterium]